MAAYDVAVIGGVSYDLTRSRTRCNDWHIEERCNLPTPDKTLCRALVKY